MPSLHVVETVWIAWGLRYRSLHWRILRGERKRQLRGVYWGLCGVQVTTGVI